MDPIEFHLAGLIAIGWLINLYVARNYDISADSLSLGFKVSLATLIGSWAFLGIRYSLLRALR